MTFFSDEMRRDPYPTYARLREQLPVLPIPGTEIWLLLGHEAVRRALGDHEAFSSDMVTAGRANPEWFIFFDPPRHTKLRALVVKAFTPRVVAGLEPRIKELSGDLLDEVIERGEMDLVGDFAVPLPTRVIADLLGAPGDDLPMFKRWADIMLTLATSVSGEETAASVAVYRAMTGEMHAYVAAQVQERRAAPRDDLLTRLVEAEVDGEHLMDSEILGFFQLLLVAGSETTTNLIANAIVCLLEHPDQLARLREAPALLPTAIEEVLRYRSPVQAVFRATRQAVELQGVQVPAGKLVLPLIGAANRDPAQFEHPDRFDIGRDPNPHIAFGHGVHFCLGAALSRLEARIGLADLLARCGDLTRATEEPWTPRLAFHVHGPSALPVRFTPASRSRG